MTTAIGSDLNLASLGTTTASANAKRNTVDQDTFLKLMVTQLKNQDPFKPLDASAFLSQLAQFSSVSSLNSMSKSVSDLATSMTANQALQASSLIGRTVLIDGNTGSLASGQPLTGAVELPYATSSGVVSIYDQSGALIRQMPLGSRDTGLNRFSWDGVTSTGQTAPPGTYTFKAAVRTADGDAALSTYTATKVTSISLSSDLAASSITTDSGQQVKLAQVKAIQ